MNAATSSRVAVVEAGSEHVGALAEFYRRVWNPDATERSVEAARTLAAETNRAEPGTPPPTWLVLQDGQAIAHLTTIPLTLWIGGRERPAYWLKGLWVLPEHQRSAAGFLVLRAATAALTHTLALAHEPAAIRLFTALGFTDLGGLPNRIRIIDARSLLQHLDVEALQSRVPAWMAVVLRHARRARGMPGMGVDAAQAVWSGVASARLRGSHSIVLAPTADPDELDALWASVRDGFPAGARRNATYFSDRYAGENGYVYVLARSQGRLVGVGVVKRPKGEADARLAGVRLASLSDVLFHPGDAAAGMAVMRGAERAARELGADAMLCSASADALAPLMRRRGYLASSENLRLLARMRDAVDGMPARIGDWWVTRGDCEADGGF